MARSTSPDFSNLSTFQVLQRLYEGDRAVEAWLYTKHKESVTQQIRGKTADRFRFLIPADGCFTDAWLSFLETI